MDGRTENRMLTALSPVYSLILGTKVMIVLSSDQAIKDLLDKRSGIYSSRPEMYLGQVVSGGLRVLLMVCCSEKGQCTASLLHFVPPFFAS